MKIPGIHSLNSLERCISHGKANFIPYFKLMKTEQVISQLETNRLVFKALLERKEKAVVLWKPEGHAWTLLEIVCHLLDEEREDFRTRVFNTLFTPDLQPPSINPPAWVKERNYAGQDFDEKLADFLKERKNSIKKLKALKEPQWSHVFHHPLAGPLTAYQLLCNWLAHDYHHIRQINRRLYEYLQYNCEVGLGYAGEW